MKNQAPTDENGCVKCGTCNTVCPVFNVTGHEAHGARGKHHLKTHLQEADRSPLFADIFSKCLLCGACVEACPRELDTPQMVITARGELPRLAGLSFIKYVSRKALIHPALIGGLTRVGSVAKKLLSEHLPPESGLRLRLLSFDPDILRLPEKSYLDSLPNTDGEKDKTADSKTGQQPINYFVGCFANHLQPEIAEKTALLVSRIGKGEPVVPKEQTCCGMAALVAGKSDEARALAKKNIEVYEGNDLPILTSCSSCYFQLMTYEELFADDPEWHQRARRFSARLVEFSSFFNKNLPGGLKFIPTKERAPEQKVFYHDPCHLRFQLKITREPRELLQQLKGVKLQELSGGPQCCGQGGLFQVAHPELALQVRDRLLEDFSSLAVDTVVTGCSGCLLQWQIGLAAKHKKIQAEHLAVFIARLLQ
jgi:glycolate oxidase iron-sulfur subunit